MQTEIISKTFHVKTQARTKMYEKSTINKNQLGKRDIYGRIKSGENLQKSIHRKGKGNAVYTKIYYAEKKKDINKFFALEEGRE